MPNRGKLLKKSLTPYIRQWFLYGDGGALSKYSDSYGGNSWGIEKIIPFSESEAKEWAEEYLSAEEYEELFGSVEE